jgi:uncharacterized membrane protein
MTATSETKRRKSSHRFDTLLTVVLIITVLNTAYLSWRFIGLHAGWVTSGTGICSWTATIDCDKVLVTPEARAFYVPNAILAFGFFFGCLMWWVLGARLGRPYRHHITRTLAFWLGVATLFTFRFVWLLIHLDAFCPFCPWNHVLTYLAFAVVFIIWRSTPRPTEPASLMPLVLLVCVCVGQFFFWQLLWLIAHSRGII